jgi:hypothetical protein
MQYCCNISIENVSIYVLSIHFTWTGWKDMQKKSSIQKSKNELHFYTENSLRVQESQWSSLFAYRSHELGTVLLTYASNETKIYRLYLQEHKNKLQYSQT